MTDYFKGEGQKTATEAFNAKVEELIKNNDVEKLSIRLADIEQDSEYIKNLNENISMRYQEMLACFPTEAELEFIIQKYISEGMTTDPLITERIQKLKKFKSAIIALEKQNEKQVTPYKLPEEHDEQ